MAQGAQLTKQAVAHRLILSAVQMIEKGHDPLAVHCVAASASNLLRELVATRGQTYGSRVFGAALFENALARIERRVPVGRLPSDPVIDAIIDTVRQGIESGAINSAQDVDVEIPKHVERVAMNSVVAPFNFMKHADKDATTFLDEGDLRPIDATAHAIAAYALLFPGEALSDEVRSFLDSHVVS
jgi:hypothetical protein